MVQGSTIETALKNPGPILLLRVNEMAHPNEAVFSQKKGDILQFGYAFYRVRSRKATVRQAQRQSSEFGQVAAIIIEPLRGLAPGDASVNERARFYSEDAVHWKPLPNGMNPVRGKLDEYSCGLVLGELTPCVEDVSINLWEYEDYTQPGSPILFEQWNAAICARRTGLVHRRGEMDSPVRRVLAVGWLVKPFGVWLGEDY